MGGFFQHLHVVLLDSHGFIHNLKENGLIRPMVSPLHYKT